MKKNSSLIFFFSFIFLFSSLFAELRTTANPKDYNTHKVVEVNADLITLENGTILKILLPQGDGVRVTKDEIIYYDEYGVFWTKKISDFFNITVGDTVEVGYIYLSVSKDQEKKYYEEVSISDIYKIEQIEKYFWAGEVQPYITLNDGSKWLLSEKSVREVVDWEVGDIVIIKDDYMTTERTKKGAQIVFYTIHDNYFKVDYNEFIQNE